MGAGQPIRQSAVIRRRTRAGSASPSGIPPRGESVGPSGRLGPRPHPPPESGPESSRGGLRRVSSMGSSTNAITITRVRYVKSPGLVPG